MQLESVPWIFLILFYLTLNYYDRNSYAQGLSSTGWNLQKIVSQSSPKSKIYKPCFGDKGLNKQILSELSKKKIFCNKSTQVTDISPHYEENPFNMNTNEVNISNSSRLELPNTISDDSKKIIDSKTIYTNLGMLNPFENNMAKLDLVHAEPEDILHRTSNKKYKVPDLPSLSIKEKIDIYFGVNKPNYDTSIQSLKYTNPKHVNTSSLNKKKLKVDDYSTNKDSQYTQSKTSTESTDSYVLPIENRKIDQLVYIMNQKAKLDAIKANKDKIMRYKRLNEIEKFVRDKALSYLQAEQGKYDEISPTDVNSMQEIIEALPPKAVSNIPLSSSQKRFIDKVQAEIKEANDKYSNSEKVRNIRQLEMLEGRNKYITRHFPNTIEPKELVNEIMNMEKQDEQKVPNNEEKKKEDNLDETNERKELKDKILQMRELDTISGFTSKSKSGTSSKTSATVARLKYTQPNILLKGKVTIDRYNGKDSNINTSSRNFPNKSTSLVSVGRLRTPTPSVSAESLTQKFRTNIEFDDNQKNKIIKLLKLQDSNLQQTPNMSTNIKNLIQSTPAVAQVAIKQSHGNLRSDIFRRMPVSQPMHPNTQRKSN